jgi:hypothetical protein
VITQAYSPNNLHPGNEFTYTIQFTNTGDSDAEDVQVLLRDSQDILQITNPLQTIGDIAEGESATITFDCTLSDKALDTVALNDRYNLGLYWGYTTENGYVQDIDDNSDTVYLRTSTVPQVEPVQEVTPTFSSDQSQVLSYAIFAIGIIVAALVIMFGIARLASNVNKWRYEDTKRKEGKGPEPDEEKPKKEKEPEPEPEPEKEEEEDLPAPPPAEEKPSKKKGDVDEDIVE